MKNKDRFEKWNETMHKNDRLAPWNDPLKKNDPSACWNSMSGQGNYRDEVDRWR